MFYTLMNDILHYYPNLLLLFVMVKTFSFKEGRFKWLKFWGAFLILTIWDYWSLNIYKYTGDSVNFTVYRLFLVAGYIVTAYVYSVLALEGWSLYKLTLIMMWWFFYGAARSVIFAVTSMLTFEAAGEIWLNLFYNNLVQTFFSIFLIKLRVNSSIRISPIICYCVTALCFGVEELIISFDRDLGALAEAGYLTKELSMFLFLIAIMVFVYWCISRLLRQMETLSVQAYQARLHGLELDSAKALYAQNRKYTHDVKNQMMTMSILMKNRNYKELENFFQEYEEESERAAAEGKSSGNSVLDAILYREEMKAGEREIPMKIQASLPDSLNISRLDLSAVLFNCIDNALEASEGVKDPFVCVQIRKNQGFIFIKISNRVSENILEQNPHLRTTKPDSVQHGNGVKIVRHIVEKYEGDIQYTQEENLFIVSVMLQDNKRNK